MHRPEGNLATVTTCMGPEVIMLSEINQKRNDKYIKIQDREEEISGMHSKSQAKQTSFPNFRCQLTFEMLLTWAVCSRESPC